MRILKYIGAILLTLLALSQLSPIYSVITDLLQGSDEFANAYLSGKLSGHLFMVFLLLVVATKLYKSARMH